MCDRFISHPSQALGWLCIQPMQPLLEAAQADLELREMWRCRMGLCMLISVLLPSREMGATAWPQCWGERWAWELLWWLSSIRGFGHFCGRRGSSYRYVAIEEVKTISK